MMFPLKNAFLFSVFSVCVLFANGCASTVENAHRQKTPIMTEFTAGAVAKAREDAQNKISNDVDELMWVLETATLDFLLNNNDASIAGFNHAEALIHDYDERAVVNAREVGAETAAILTNPNTLPYTGFSRDRIMIPVFRAFAYLGKGDEDGFRVELMKMRENQDRVALNCHKQIQKEEEAIKKAEREQNLSANTKDVLNNDKNAELKQNIKQVEQVARKGYGNFMNPLAIFLSGYGYMRDRDYENALVDFERLYKVMPESPLAKQYYTTALALAKRIAPISLTGIQPLPFDIGANTVTVIFANGRTAAMRQMSMYIPVVVPGYATVACAAWPAMEFYTRPVSNLLVRAGGMDYSTVPLADMDGIMAQEYYERLPGQLTRMILSVAAKEVASYFAMKAAQRSDNGTAVALTALGTTFYKYAFNTADTRTWETLPSEYQVVQFPMPADHKVILNTGLLAPMTLDLPGNARSAILYVNIPSSFTAAIAVKPYYLYAK